MKKLILFAILIATAYSCKDKPVSEETTVDTTAVTTEAREAAIVANSNVYKSCGRITINGANKTASVKTLLPQIQDANYQVTYYNISSATHFGLLAVLTSKYKTDLRLRNETAVYTQLNSTPIELSESKLPRYRNGKSFDDLKSTDTVSIVCFHDSKFADNADSVKEYYQDLLPNVVDVSWPGNKSTESINQPKVGNGGILSATGCP